MNVRVWSRRIGVVLILTGIAWIGGWYGWVATRVWNPLDVPVALAPGHTQTADFEVNVESEYSIGILPVNPAYPTDEMQCWLGLNRCPGSSALLQVRGTLRRGDQVIYRITSESSRRWLSTGERYGATLGTVKLSTGKYVLDFESLSDAKPLDVHSPRLMVVESGGVYWECVEQQDDALISSFLLLSGLALVIGVYWLAFRLITRGGGRREQRQYAAR